MNDLDRLDLVRAADGRLAIALPDGIPGGDLRWLLDFLRDANSTGKRTGLNPGLVLNYAIVNFMPNPSAFHEFAVDAGLYESQENADNAAKRVAEWMEMVGLSDFDPSAPIDFTADDSVPSKPHRPEGDTSLSGLLIDDGLMERARAIHIARGGNPNDPLAEYAGAILFSAITAGDELSAGTH